MATRTKIYVTEECIENGAKGNRISCPIALAFADAGFFNTSVEYSSIYYYESEDENGDYGRQATTAPEICDWQNAFDSDEVVKPMTLELIRVNDAKNLFKSDKLLVVE